MESDDGQRDVVRNAERQRVSATVRYDGWVSMSSAETYATIAEAITAAAIKMLDMPERLQAMDREAQTV